VRRAKHPFGGVPSVVCCDREAPIMRRSWPTRGCCAVETKESAAPMLMKTIFAGQFYLLPTLPNLIEISLVFARKHCDPLFRVGFVRVVQRTHTV
jgi:hypothetical protein